jgi:hypothetical protein
VVDEGEETRLPVQPSTVVLPSAFAKLAHDAEQVDTRDRKDARHVEGSSVDCVDLKSSHFEFGVSNICKVRGWGGGKYLQIGGGAQTNICKEKD